MKRGLTPIASASASASTLTRSMRRVTAVKKKAATVAAASAAAFSAARATAAKVVPGKSGRQHANGRGGSGWNKGISRMLPFVEARAMVRKFKLGSQDEWEEWRRGSQRPKDIPSNPSKVYKNSGFISFPDWLGYKGRQPPGLMLPFGQARDFARKLKLRSRDAWQVFSKSGKRPANIPSTPWRVSEIDR